MEPEVLALRRQLLRQTQNADGGWGYFAGKQSWMEPTAYALLALHGDPESAAAAARGWALLRTWQTSGGGWRPSAQVPEATWVTALGVTLCVVREDFGAHFERGVAWLVANSGVGAGWLARALAVLPGREAPGRDLGKRGWAWRTDSMAWVEPTAHSLVALKKASRHLQNRELAGRIEEGEQLLLSMRSTDGGWNYGSARALGIELPSYPETTALAWLGLQEHVPADCRLPGDRNRSRLAAAWLSIVGSLTGRPAAIDPPAAEPPADLMVASLEAMAAPGGNGALLRTGGTSA